MSMSELVYRRPCEHGNFRAHWWRDYELTVRRDCPGGVEIVLDPERLLGGDWEQDILDLLPVPTDWPIQVSVDQLPLTVSGADIGLPGPNGEWFIIRHFSGTIERGERPRGDTG